MVNSKSKLFVFILSGFKISFIAKCALLAEFLSTQVIEYYIATLLERTLYLFLVFMGLLF